MSPQNRDKQVKKIENKRKEWLNPLYKWKRMVKKK